MTEWQEVTIEKIASPDRYSVVGGPFGSALGRKDYVDHGVPIIRGAQLSGPGSFTHHDLVFVSEEKADRHRGNLAYPGDVLVTQRGTVGQIGLIPNSTPYDRYLLSQSQMKLTVDPVRADARFIYYWLLSHEAQHQMRGATISAGVPHINLETFKSLTIRLPPLPTQHFIASVLATIDDLIENHRRRVEVLEEMARVIYREWFVRFLFPGYETATFVDSKKGRIPSDWSISTLGDSARWLSGGTPSTTKAEYWGGSIPWITSGTLTSLLLDRSDRTLTEVGAANGTRMVDRDALLFVVRGMSLVKEFRVGIADTRLAFGQDVKALVAVDDIDPMFLAFSVITRADEIQRMVELAGHGTGKLSTDRLKAIEIVHPPTALQSRFARAVQPLRDLMTTMRLVTDRLIQMRDELLPKLVSGEVDLSSLDLDALVEVSVA